RYSRTRPAYGTNGQSSNVCVSVCARGCRGAVAVYIAYVERNYTFADRHSAAAARDPAQFPFRDTVAHAGGNAYDLHFGVAVAVAFRDRIHRISVRRAHSLARA